MSSPLSSTFENVIPEAGNGSPKSSAGNPLVTPFENPEPFAGLQSAPGTYGHDTSSAFSKPHSCGPDTIPMKFYEQTPGGVTGEAPLNSPFTEGIPINNLK